MAEPLSYEQPSDFLTVKEAAEFLGVSPWTLRNWDNAGKLTPRRHPLNGYRMYMREDLEKISPLVARKKAAISPVNFQEVQDSEHLVQFYETEGELVRTVSEYSLSALLKGHALILIATAEHLARIENSLKRRGFDLKALRESRQYSSLDAADTLLRFMRRGLPDETAFNELMNEVIGPIKDSFPKVRAFGEMVTLLLSEGNKEAVHQLEKLWESYTKNHNLSLLCAYPLSLFPDESAIDEIKTVCANHTKVLPTDWSLATD